MKKANFLLFMIICFGFSLAMLLAALFGAVELADINSELAQCRKEIELISRENDVLKVKAANAVSIQEIDIYAREQLHMQTPTERQICFIEIIDELE